jgi:DNA-binding GntR family transcriptional regulator
MLVAKSGRRDQAALDHLQIMQAFKERDADAVEDAIRRHLRHTVAALTADITDAQDRT